MADRIAVVGLGADGLCGVGSEARCAIERATLVVGGRRHLAAFAPPSGTRTAPLTADVGAALDEIEAEAGPVCVLASGDPGFFGIVRPLAERFGAEGLEVHPAPSFVALAFARLGMAWDDAAVVSAHGRPLTAAARAASSHAKVAVLVSPDSPPEALGRALLELGVTDRRAAVCARLGAPDERVDLVDLHALAAGTWDPISVVILLAEPDRQSAPVLAWGLPDGSFDHRDGMITHAEVRAVALGKLSLPSRGVVWDVGAGSGSVAIECARSVPAARVLAVEENIADAERISHNADRHGVTVEVVTGRAPAAFEGLPDPDRVFVGGGGHAVLSAVLERLRPGGRVVATYAAVDRAVAAADRLGAVVQVAVSRGRRLPDGGLRLAAENPVFVAWGPQA
ncbi:MAG TPA: precorrin-6y C5,15-methyltransferase (decarboxylating) subunit CbiE [Acidimicrobiales bacterium]